MQVSIKRLTVLFLFVVFLLFFYISCDVFVNPFTAYNHHLNQSRRPNGVYGSGTVIVDVKGLSRRQETRHNRHNRTISKKPNSVKHQIFNSKVSRCFELIWPNNNTAKQKFVNQRNCKTIMNIELLPGRSGNQMFQIAALLGTAYKLNILPAINPNIPLVSWLELPNLINVNLTDSTLFTVKQSGVYSTEIHHLNREKNWTLKGYFQSWRYFNNAEHVIGKAFKVKKEYIDKAKSFLNNTSKPGFNNVCVHVRRGDFDDNTMIKKGYAHAGLDFIYRAMSFYRMKLKTVQFIVLSDGILWCQDNIRGQNVIFSPFYRPAEDMALMTLCDHVIVTSGTFGWWGAWLSRGLTVYYSGFPRPGSWLDTQIKRDDYYPPNWIGL